MKMGMMILVSVLSFTTAQAKGKASKSGKKSAHYPVVESVQGKADQVESLVTVVKRAPKQTEKDKPLKKGMTFKDKAHFRTGEKASLRLKLSDTSTLILEENSEARLPDIEWKDGGTKVIQILSGRLRYICQANCDRKLISPLSETVPPVGDYLLAYDPKVPQVQLSVLTGEVPFRGMENESSVVLHAGETATFTGVLENNEPVFDVLLHGRKAAKGKLSEVQKLPEDFVQQLQKQEQDLVAAQKKVKKPKRTAAQICDKPWGELNQCAWVCEKNKKGAKDCAVSEGAQCVRLRCNANGEWSDRSELSAGQSACKAEPVVSACDY